jgi:protease-4
MKQFFGAFFGSIVGMVVATFVAVLILVVVVKSSISSAGEDDSKTTVKENTVLRLNLEGQIGERSKEDPFKDLGGLGNLGDGGELGLNDMIAKIDAAAKDDKIKGIYLNFKMPQIGFATLEELRNALLAFKKSGKFLYSYGEIYTQRDIYLASASTKVFVNPQGGVDWRGLGMNVLFFKNAFEKLDIDVQIFRHGKFKSAIEPFMLDKMSEANRLQAETYISALWGRMVEGISKERKISAEELNALANNLSIRLAPDAKGKFVDQLSYEDEVLTEIKKKVGIKEKDKLKFVELSDYTPKEKSEGKNDKIAVIYATGSIGGGEGDDEQIGSDRLAKAIREARLDEKVKAIVLRVNSPGGGALASDIIWHEMQLATKAKPTVVSMGDVAASGGYYIACAANRIFAQPNTLTGSIGVFGMIPSLKRMMENKLGITIDTVNSNKYSDMGAFRLLTEKEKEAVQSTVENVYTTFLSRVAEGRKMTSDAVDSIGQGRVWAGSDAVKNGLVDELGGLEDAIKWVAQKAKVKEYKLQELPRQIGPFDGLFGKKEKEFESKIMQHQLGNMYEYFRQVQEMMKMQGVQARLPYMIQYN